MNQSLTFITEIIAGIPVMITQIIAIAGFTIGINAINSDLRAAPGDHCFTP